MATGIITAIYGIMVMIGAMATIIYILGDIRTTITDSVMGITGSIMTLGTVATDLAMVSATVMVTTIR